MGVERSTERKFKDLQWLLHQSIELYGVGHPHTIYLSQELDKAIVLAQREMYFSSKKMINNETIFNGITNIK